MGRFASEDTRLSECFLRHEARTLQDYIIEHIPEAELRASFTARPEVVWLRTDGESHPPVGPN